MRNLDAVCFPMRAVLFLFFIFRKNVSRRRFTANELGLLKMLKQMHFICKKAANKQFICILEFAGAPPRSSLLPNMQFVDDAITAHFAAVLRCSGYEALVKKS